MKCKEEYNPIIHERELTIHIKETELLNAFASIENFKSFLKEMDNITGLPLADLIVVKEGEDNEDP